MKNDKLSTKRSTKKRSTGNLLLCATAVAGLASTGCASDIDDGQATESAAPEAPLALLANSGSSSLRDPNGLYFADVTANGTGCPAGTWNTSISSDGQTFTTTFSAYEATVDRGTAIAAKDCQISIKLHSPAGTSYAVQEFFYSGYAFLDEGVTARQTARYYFQGTPVGANENRTELRGPRDQSYLFSDVVKTVDQVWSPCGKERDLQIVTRVSVDNGVRRNGYINLSALDGRINGKLVLKLGVKKCDGSSGSTGGSTGGWPNNGNDDEDDDNGGGGNNGGWNNGGNNGNNGGWNNGGNSGNNGGWNNGGRNGGWNGNGGPVVIGGNRDIGEIDRDVR